MHFTGIGGAGMSGIARIMLARGVPVSGTDSADSALLDELAALGARVAVGHDAGHLGDADTLVVSSAIRPDNPELVGRPAARAPGAAPLRGAGRGYGRPPRGRHRRNARQDHHDLDADHDPAPRGRRPVLRDRRRSWPRPGLGADDGRGEVFVAEADESDGSFLNLSPRAAAAVVTCVEADHLDNYASLAEIEAAFAGVRGPDAARRDRWSSARTTRAAAGWPPRPAALTCGCAVRLRAGRRLPGDRRSR